MDEVFMAMIALVIPFAGIIFGLVEFAKSVFSLKGVAITAVSFGIGVFFGVLALVAYMYPELSAWIAGVVFVLSVGLVASGYYKFADARWPRPE